MGEPESLGRGVCQGVAVRPQAYLWGRGYGRGSSGATVSGLSDGGHSAAPAREVGPPGILSGALAAKEYTGHRCDAMATEMAV